MVVCLLVHGMALDTWFDDREPASWHAWPLRGQGEGCSSPHRTSGADTVFRAAVRREMRCDELLEPLGNRSADHRYWLDTTQAGSSMHAAPRRRRPQPPTCLCPSPPLVLPHAFDRMPNTSYSSVTTPLEVPRTLNNMKPSKQKNTHAHKIKLNPPKHPFTKPSFPHLPSHPPAFPRPTCPASQTCSTPATHTSGPS